jgi:hypothetical protein
MAALEARNAKPNCANVWVEARLIEHEQSLMLDTLPLAPFEYCRSIAARQS